MLAVTEVIALDGGNEYREGREGGLMRPYNSKERKDAYAKQLAGYANTEEDSRDATIVQDQADEEGEEEELLWVDENDESDGTLSRASLTTTTRWHIKGNAAPANFISRTRGFGSYDKM
ncbi:MAG: hypothetical protein MMC33_010794 [Icmadophila ericetorum]|nr:hypothetical protein [Icmadophila ericetorum]